MAAKTIKREYMGMEEYCELRDRAENLANTLSFKVHNLLVNVSDPDILKMRRRGVRETARELSAALRTLTSVKVLA